MDPLEVKPLGPRRRGRRRLRTPNPEVRRRIVDAAGELILEHGVPSLRIDEVAELAGCSVGTLYLYFDGKDEIFTALVVEQTAQLRARLNAASDGAPDHARAGQRRLAAYLDFVEQTERGFLHFVRAGSMETTAGDLNTWAFEQHANDLRPILKELLGPGPIDPVELELLVQSNLAVTQHLASYWLEHRDQLTRQQLEQFLGKVTAAVLLALRSS